MLPHRFLFRCSLPVLSDARLPRRGARPLDLSEAHRLQDLAPLDDGPSFADVRVGWNKDGLGLSVTVQGKREPLQCDARNPMVSDAAHFWIDTRNTQNIHRASRFCHRFVILPTDSSEDGSGVYVDQLPIPRAREEAPMIHLGDLKAYSAIEADGFHLELWLPAKALHGFDPANNPHVGFYYFIRDNELGDQCLSVDTDFPFDEDPSLWWTLEMVDAPKRKSK